MTALTGVLADQRVIPVLVIDDHTVAPDVTVALAEAGLGCAEITLRTPAGLAAIAAATSAGPSCIIGAGTVLTRTDVDRVADAGARSSRPDSMRMWSSAHSRSGSTCCQASPPRQR